MLGWFKPKKLTATEDDIIFLSLICLGTRPDHESVIASRLGLKPFGLFKSFLSTRQFRRNVIEPFILGKKPRWLSYADVDQKILQEGFRRYFPNAEYSAATCGHWSTALHTVLQQPTFARAYDASNQSNELGWLIDQIAQTAIDYRPIQGVIEAFDKQGIHGYAFVTNESETKPLTLDMFFNDAYVGTTITGEERRDLVEKQIAPLDAGFSLTPQISETLAREDSVVINVFEKETGQAIGPALETALISSRNANYYLNLLDELKAVRTHAADDKAILSALNAIENRLPDIERYAALPLEAYETYRHLFHLGAPPDDVAATKTSENDFMIVCAESDTLEEHASAHLIAQFISHPDAHICFADYDRQKSGEAAATPILRGAFDYDLLLADPTYPTAYAIRRSTYDALFPSDGNTAKPSDTEVWFRVYEKFGASAFTHCPHILWHIRSSLPLADREQETVRLEHLERQNQPAKVMRFKDSVGGDNPHRFAIHWQAETPAKKLAIIIPTRDALSLVRAAVESLLETIEETAQTEIIIVDNDSKAPETIAWLNEISQQTMVRVIRYEGTFNWAAINNKAVVNSDADYLLFLNNDTKAVQKGWDTRLRGQLTRQDIGAVGARLLFEDGTIQYAGYSLHPDHIALKDGYGEEPLGGGYNGLSQTTRETSAIIGAFLGCRRDVFDEVRGFDKKSFAVAFNDIDFSLRLKRAGYRNLYCPQITFYHYESKSRGYDHLDDKKRERERRERIAMQKKHGGLLAHDPFYPDGFVACEPTHSLLSTPKG